MKTRIIVTLLVGTLYGCSPEPSKTLDNTSLKSNQDSTLVVSNFDTTQSVNANSIVKKLDVIETANCSAAAMKSQDSDTFTRWFNELQNRYMRIYPDKNKSEIEAYTTERILDKRRSLESKGFDSKPAFDKYYRMNCIDFDNNL